MHFFPIFNFFYYLKITPHIFEKKNTNKTKINEIDFKIHFRSIYKWFYFFNIWTLVLVDLFFFIFYGKKIWYES